MPTTVVNLTKEKCDVKITRTPKNQIPEPPEFGCFGNPFSLKRFDREECLILYRDYFHKRLETDPKFKEAVLSLKDKKLGCFCKQTLSTERSETDLACHGDVIKEYLDSHLPEDIFMPVDPNDVGIPVGDLLTGRDKLAWEQTCKEIEEYGTGTGL